MTNYYLWHFPDAGQCVIKSMGLHRIHLVIPKEEGESESQFKIRAKEKFDHLYDEWLAQVGDDFKNGEIISTKTLQ